MNTGDIRLHPVRPEKEREKQAAPKGRVAQLAKYVEQREANTRSSVFSDLCAGPDGTAGPSEREKGQDHFHRTGIQGRNRSSWYWKLHALF